MISKIPWLVLLLLFSPHLCHFFSTCNIRWNIIIMPQSQGQEQKYIYNANAKKKLAIVSLFFCYYNESSLWLGGIEIGIEIGIGIGFGIRINRKGTRVVGNKCFLFVASLWPKEEQQVHVHFWPQNAAPLKCYKA